MADARYLVYDRIGTPGGLFHNFANLSAQLREAALLGRKLVAPPPQLASAHNRSHPPPRDWARYTELENSLMRIRYANGDSAIQPLPVALPSDSRHAAADARERLCLPADAAVSAADNQRWAVIAKTLPPDDGRMNRFIIPLADYFARTGIADIETGFKPSARVESLAAPVRHALAADDAEGDYAALHFRLLVVDGRRSWLRLPGGALAALFVDDLKRLIPRGMPLYFMTNHHGGRYARRLGKHFRVLTWREFPHLQQLLTTHSTPPDDYILAQVEYALFADAKIKLAIRPHPLPRPSPATVLCRGNNPSTTCRSIWWRCRSARRCGCCGGAGYCDVR